MSAHVLDAVLDQAAQVDPHLANHASQVASSNDDPVNARLARLDAMLDRLYDLETDKAKDKNGRLKSGLWGALFGFLQGVGGARAGRWDQWEMSYSYARSMAEKQARRSGVQRFDEWGQLIEED